MLFVTTTHPHLTTLPLTDTTHPYLRLTSLLTLSWRRLTHVIWKLLDKSYRITSMFQQPLSRTQQRLLRFGVTPKIYKFWSFRKFDTIIHPVASIQYPLIMLFVKCQCYSLLMHDANMLLLSCSSSHFLRFFIAEKYKFHTPVHMLNFEWYSVFLLHCAFSFTKATLHITLRWLTTMGRHLHCNILVSASLLLTLSVEVSCLATRCAIVLSNFRFS